MVEFLLFALSFVQVWFRGKTTVQTAFTNLELINQHRIKLQDGTLMSAVLRCRQIRHVVQYERWFLMKRIHFTYQVEMLHENGDRNGYQVHYYPHLCVKWMHRTTYPLSCAINAHLDFLARGV